MFYKEITEISKVIDAQTFLEHNSSDYDYCPETIYYSTSIPKHLQDTPQQDKTRIKKTIDKFIKQAGK